MFEWNLCLGSDFDELQFNASPEEFTSKKITTKILQQIEVRLMVLIIFSDDCYTQWRDKKLMFHGCWCWFSQQDVGVMLVWCLCPQEPLALASGALPDWCEQLTSKCPFLIPFETRQLYFTCTAFGASRWDWRRAGRTWRHSWASPDKQQGFKLSEQLYLRLTLNYILHIFSWTTLRLIYFFLLTNEWRGNVQDKPDKQNEPAEVWVKLILIKVQRRLKIKD